MFTRIRNFLRFLFNKTRIINNQPLNKVSLIVIIFIDIFILVNVFTGLNDISRWYISPSQAYPCYSEWKDYRTQTNKDKDYQILQNHLRNNTNNQPFQQIDPQNEARNLGNVSKTCLQFADTKKKINNLQNQQIIKAIDLKQGQISKFEESNRNIRTQYDSTLLEKIAGQAREQSINSVAAEKAKQQLEQNQSKISNLKNEISNLKNELLTKPEITNYITLLKDANQFNRVEKGYQKASFWYPSIQLVFQAFFLLPLIIIALSVHNFAQRRGYGLISLMSWHLLVIFSIPLLLKIFEFLQIGVVFKFVFDIIQTLFGGLLFLISYVYILLIPLIGFGIIKFFQKIVFNTKLQAAKRVEQVRCINCAKKIRHHDNYCPHCGYDQLIECPNCHNRTYKYLPYCKHCGYAQNISRL